jgi:hypothetical protein
MFTWRYNPEDQHRHLYRRENIKSQIFSSSPFHTGSGANAAYPMDIACPFLGGKRGRIMTLTTHLNLAPRLRRTRGALPLFPLLSSHDALVQGQIYPFLFALISISGK